jgi:hypothetical protein
MLANPSTLINNTQIMKYKTAFTFVAVASFGVVCAQGLYYVGDDTFESSPIRWTVGVSAVFDDNINPSVTAGPGKSEEAWSLNPTVGASFSTKSPQTTIDFYARAGVNYYLTESDLEGADDTTPNARFTFDLTHRINERLRFSSRNFMSYEMEPEYAYGISNQRGSDPSAYWTTDNSVGYRWSERLGSFTGFTLNGYLSDAPNSDRDSWAVYHQLRYVTSPRSTLTAGYRYSEWSGGNASDSQNHYWTVGLEHRLSSTSILVLNGGVQLRDVDNGDSSTSPYFEVALNNRVNSSFSIRGFTRYSVEDLDTIRTIGATTYEYSDQQVLRVGLTGEYILTPRLSGFGGVDYVSTSFDAGNELGGGPLTSGGQAEDLVNLYVGLRAKLSDQLTGECSINYTDSGSDFEGRDYDRLRLSAGVSYSF